MTSKKLAVTAVLAVFGLALISSGPTNRPASSNFAMVQASTAAKGKYGNRGPAKVPSRLQGTWYSTDDGGSTVTFGKHSFREKETDDSSMLKLYKQDSRFLQDHRNTTDERIEDATDSWGRITTTRAKGMHWLTVYEWTETGDGTSYAVHSEKVDGQEIKILVDAEGPNYEVEHIYYQTQALANQYSNHRFADLNYDND